MGMVRKQSLRIRKIAQLTALILYRFARKQLNESFFHESENPIFFKSKIFVENAFSKFNEQLTSVTFNFHFPLIFVTFAYSFAYFIITMKRYGIISIILRGQAPSLESSPGSSLILWRIFLAWAVNLEINQGEKN